MDHTKEPWVNKESSVYGAEDDYIGYLEDFSDEDIRRVIACVNACAVMGVSTEALEEIASTKAPNQLAAALTLSYKSLSQGAVIVELLDQIGLLRKALQFSVEVETRIMTERLGSVDAWLAYETKPGATRDQIDCARDFRQKLEALAATTPKEIPNGRA